MTAPENEPKRMTKTMVWGKDLAVNQTVRMRIEQVRVLIMCTIGVANLSLR